MCTNAWKGRQALNRRASAEPEANLLTMLLLHVYASLDQRLSIDP
jgi:hypothetical protein